MDPRTWAPWIAIALVSAVYGRLVVGRNRRLVPPPLVDLTGSELPERELALSDGETVAYVDVGPAVAGAKVRPARAGAEGERPTVVLVPGADGIKETFRFQIPALSTRHRVVCASLRRAFRTRDTLDRMVDDIRELVDAVGAGPLILVGQSLGGAIAMRFAVRHPDRVRALVVCNGLARVSYRHLGLNRTLLVPLAMASTRYLPTVLARWLARLWSRLEVWIYDASPGSDKVIDYALWTGPRTVPSAVSRERVDRLKATDLRPELPSIGVPTLILKGPRDHYVPPAWSREIAALIPRSLYLEIPGTGHCSHVSMPGSFNGRLLDWLDGLGARTSGAAAADGSEATK